MAIDSSLRRRSVEWVGSSQRDIRDLPIEPRREFGQAIFEAELGGKHPNAKPLKGDAFKGAGVLEVVSDFDGDTFRAVYTVRLEGALYVLHVFQKKSTKGVKTSKAAIELIKRRYAQALEHHKMHYQQSDTG